MSAHDPAADVRTVQEDPVPAPDRSTKIPHLVMALLFLGTAAVWALVVTGALAPAAVPYTLPTLLVGAGVIGLAAVVLGNRRRSDTHDEKADTLHDDWTDEDPQTLPLYQPEEYR